MTGCSGLLALAFPFPLCYSNRVGGAVSAHLNGSVVLSASTHENCKTFTQSQFSMSHHRRTSPSSSHAMQQWELACLLRCIRLRIPATAHDVRPRLELSRVDKLLPWWNLRYQCIELSELLIRPLLQTRDEECLYQLPSISHSRGIGVWSERDPKQLNHT